MKKVSVCDFVSRRAMLRRFSQWPTAIFKVPDIVQWIVVASEPRVIEDIRKAPDSVLSFMVAVEKVSRFL